MPVIEERRTAGGGSSMTMLLTFLIGLMIIAIAVLVILHGVMHVI